MNSELLGSAPWKLSRPVRRWANDWFRFDFGGVRLHFDSAPRRFGALALARGGSVTMLPELAAAGADVFIPVLAHELTHVLQQRGFGGRVRPGVRHDPSDEDEAIRRERAAALIHPFGRMDGWRLVEPAVEEALFPDFGVVQCASSGYGILDQPKEGISGGLRYFQNKRLHDSFRLAIEEYVRLVAPGDVGVHSYDGGPSAIRKGYVDALLDRIESKPYLLKELVGDKKVAFDDLSPADRRWVKDELYRAYDRNRIDSKNKNMLITTRLRLDHHANWLDFRTKDCVFAAILRSLVTIDIARVNPGDKGLKHLGEEKIGQKVIKDEAKEAKMEAWLADHFGIDRKVTSDVKLIHILEWDLGWKNLSSVETFADVKTHHNKAFILSYEVTPGTETKDSFWHTVYVEITGSGKAEITDRQATGLGQKGSISETAPCDAWEIDTGTSGYLEMKRQFDEKFS